MFRLVGVGPGGVSVIAKHRRWRPTDPELIVKMEILPKLRIPTPELFGLVEGDDGAATLFEEDAGDRPYSIASAEHRRLGGRWLAELHLAFASGSIDDGVLAALPDRGPASYATTLEETVKRIAGWGPCDPVAGAERSALLEALSAITDRWPEIEEVCSELPRLLVHGDFRKQNIRLRADADELLVLDWELAGLGPLLADLDHFAIDLEAYSSTLGTSLGDLPDVATLATVGGLFKVIDAASWIDAERCGPEEMRLYRDGITLTLERAERLSKIRAGTRCKA